MATALIMVVLLAGGAVVETGLVPSVVGAFSSRSELLGGVLGTGPGLALSQPPPAANVLSTTTGTPPVSLAMLRQRIRPLLALPGLGRRVGFATAELSGLGASWASGPPSAIPASTLKLLTTAAALATLGPTHRFTTTVVPGDRPGSIVLVGGGDPLLAATTPTPAQANDLYPQPASLEELARISAARLRGEGVRRVRLGYDASLFTGPAANPRWPSTYIAEDVVSPISALWVNEGRLHPGLARRSADPAQSAANAFAALLAKAGIKVSGTIAAQPVASSQPPIATVASAPLEQIVEHVLAVSDNEGAEVLLRQVAIANGLPGSTIAGVASVRQALTGVGLNLDHAVFYDGSGLSRQDLIPVRLLVQVIQTVASPAHPSLRGVLTSLPVAGFSGSLSARFVDDARTGLGAVRAKTGTLTGVDGLAGVALTRTGQAVVFVVIADRVPVTRTLEARADLDKVAAALAACGC